MWNLFDISWRWTSIWFFQKLLLDHDFLWQYIFMILVYTYLVSLFVLIPVPLETTWRSGYFTCIKIICIVKKTLLVELPGCDTQTVKKTCSCQVSVKPSTRGSSIWYILYFWYLVNSPNLSIILYTLNLVLFFFCSMCLKI